jgi:predicted nucleic acid-binding Zn ribbon protein
VGIVFKGSGFYATDHRSPSGQRSHKKTESKAEEKAEKSESSPATDKSETDE